MIFEESCSEGAERLEVVLEYGALLAGDRRAILTTDGAYQDMINRIREYLNGQGIRNPYLLTLNGQFLDATTAAGLKEGDSVVALPLVGGG